MEKKSFDYLKIFAVVGAGALIIFGSFQNIWRTMKLGWNKVIKE